jgi:hypothetical protein
MSRDPERGTPEVELLTQAAVGIVAPIATLLRPERGRVGMQQFAPSIQNRDSFPRLERARTERGNR